MVTGFCRVWTEITHERQKNPVHVALSSHYAGYATPSRYRSVNARTSAGEAYRGEIDYLALTR